MNTFMSLGQPFMDFPQSETDMETTENEYEFEVEDIKSKFIGLFKNNKHIEEVATIKDYSHEEEDSRRRSYDEDVPSKYPEQGLRDKEKTSRGQRQKKKDNFFFPDNKHTSEKFHDYPSIRDTMEFNEENLSQLLGSGKRNNFTFPDNKHTSEKFHDYPSIRDTMEFNEQNLSQLLGSGKKNNVRKIETPKPIDLLDAPFMKGIGNKIPMSNSNSNSTRKTSENGSKYENDIKKWKFDNQRKTFCSRFDSLGKDEKRKFKTEVDRVNSMFRNGENQEKIRGFIDNEARFIEKNFSQRLFSNNKNESLSWKANLMDLANSNDYEFVYE